MTMICVKFVLTPSPIVFSSIAVIWYFQLLRKFSEMLNWFVLLRLPAFIAENYWLNVQYAAQTLYALCAYSNRDWPETFVFLFTGHNSIFIYFLLFMTWIDKINLRFIHQSFRYYTGKLFKLRLHSSQADHNRLFQHPLIMENNFFWITSVTSWAMMILVFLWTSLIVNRNICVKYFPECSHKSLCARIEIIRTSKHLHSAFT